MSGLVGFEKWEQPIPLTDALDAKAQAAMAARRFSEAAVELPAPTGKALPQALVRPTELQAALEVPQKADEVWYVTVQKLRVWASSSTAEKAEAEKGGSLDAAKEGPGGEKVVNLLDPARPHAIFVVRVKPSVALVYRHVHGPAEAVPCEAALSRALAAAVTTPLAQPSGAPAPPSPGDAGDSSSSAGGGAGAAPLDTVELAPCRPGRIVFSDANTARGCLPLCAALGVTVAYYPESAPQSSAIIGSGPLDVRPYVQACSAAFHARQYGVPTPAANQPGLAVSLIAQHSVAAPAAIALIGDMMRLCRRFVAAQPWGLISERHLLRLRWPRDVSIPVPPSSAWTAGMPQRRIGSLRRAGEDVVWVRVLGNAAERAAAAGQMRPGMAVRGFVIFLKRADAEKKVLEGQARPIIQPGPDGRPRPVGIQLPNAVPNPLDMVCESCGITREELAAKHKAAGIVIQPPGGGPPLPPGFMPRCRNCQEVYFCSPECASAAEASHADFCRTHPGAMSGMPGRGGMWGFKEIVCLLDAAPSTPCDDLDAIDAAGVPAAHPTAFPTPIVYLRGQPTRPSPADMVWVMRALAIIPQLTRAIPQAFQMPLPMTSEVELDVSSSASGAAVVPFMPGLGRSNLATGVVPWYDNPALVPSKPPVGMPGGPPDVAAAMLVASHGIRDVSDVGATRCFVRVDPIMTDAEAAQSNDAMQRMRMMQAQQAAAAAAAGGGAGGGGGGGGDDSDDGEVVE